MKRPRQQTVRIMRIESNLESLGMNGLSSRVAARRTRVDRNPPSLGAPERLDRASARTPTVRPEQVARAKALLADGAYPSEATLGKVADLLARHLGTGED